MPSHRDATEMKELPANVTPYRRTPEFSETSAGVAYDHADGAGPIKPRLHNLREVLAVTSLGSPWWVDWLIVRQPINKVLKTAIVKSFAPQCRFRMLSIYESETLVSSQVDKFCARIERALAEWPA